MKISNLLFTLILLTSISCKKENIINSIVKNDFKIDSISIKDSIKIGDNLKLNYQNSILIFQNIDDNVLLDSIYSPYKKLKNYSKESLDQFIKNEKETFFTTIKDQHQGWMVSAGFADEWYEINEMKLKSNHHNYIHIQYSTKSYMGGAHGNYGYLDKVFDLDNNKRLQLSDITSIEHKELSNLLKQNIDRNATSNQNIKPSEMLLVDQIPVTDNFYFDKENLYFHYSPYEIAAYAAGDIIIPISWNTIKNTLQSDFANRMEL